MFVVHGVIIIIAVVLLKSVTTVSVQLQIPGFSVVASETEVCLLNSSVFLPMAMWH